MWHYISSFLQGGSITDELTLEGACNVLEHPTQAVVDTEISNKKIIGDNFMSKTGIITQLTENKYVIDDIYTIDKNDKDIPIGTKVLFDIYVCNGKEHALNVTLVDNEWGIDERQDSLWNTRILICKVCKRENRNLVLVPGDISVNLNNISIEFLPIVGDWVELDVKCSVNESALDLAGKIIEINKISPLRPHMETGKITSWNSEEGVGVVNRNIFFQKDCLSYGYIPVIGDKIVAEVIESDQNRCTWRAIKIIPEYISAKIGKSSRNGYETHDFEEDHSGLIIEEVNISFKKLSETRKFFVTLSNESEETIVLVNAEFLNSNPQCKLVENTVKKYEIQIGTVLNIPCECTSKNIGFSKEFLLLSFENFNIGKWINIDVSISSNEPANGFKYKPRFKIHENSGNEVIRGERLTAPPRFSSAKLPLYLVPKKLIDTVNKYDYKDADILMEELKVTKPSLFTNLSLTNYEDKFHALLHLDEIANLIAIRMYDQEKASFIANNEFLMLEIENLSERRPSIIVGDTIVASDPDDRTKLDFEGIVHKVGAKHIYIRFSQLFHDKYNGEDYSIKIVAGRTAYKRLHHAVYLAVRNLGVDLLFPTRLNKKDKQVNFLYDISPINTPNSVKNILNKIHKYKNKSHSKSSLDSSVGEEPFELELEWYNERLNSRQKHAVVNILWGVARPLPYIIFGPPGTGKTVTVIETILQIIRLLPQSRLLVTAPSNSAADLIALRLIDSGILKPGDLVRLVSFNYAVSDSIPVRLVPYCAAGSLSKDGTSINDFSRNGIQLGCSQAVLGRHRITVSTCNAAGQLLSMEFPKGHFSHIIVDEAAQAGEPDIMIPLAFLDKTSGQVILAGDPMQLGPVVLCKIAAECGLNESYLERLINRFPYIRDSVGFPDSCGYDPKLVTKLLYNYRSHPDILNLYNFLFYNNELIATVNNDVNDEKNIVSKLIEILPRTNSNKVPCVIFHGVNGDNYRSDDSPSWYNPHEAAQVFYYVNEFYRLGLSCANIGVITPYIKQVKEIRSILIEAEFDVPKIGTVEEFQGQEFDVIVLSTVRSSQDFISSDINHSLGFVASPKRLNVAISRAKFLLIIIGNPTLLYSDASWRSVINYCVENGGYTGCEFIF